MKDNMIILTCGDTVKSFNEVAKQIIEEYAELMEVLNEALSDTLDEIKEKFKILAECITTAVEEADEQARRIQYERFFGDTKHKRNIHIRKDIRYNNTIINGIHNKSHRTTIRRNLR